MDGDVPAVTLDDPVIADEIARGAAITSSGGSAGGPAGPDLIVRPDGEVVAQLPFQE